MFNFNRTKAFSIIAAVILLTPMLVSARVYFLESTDESAGSEDPTRPCVLDYPYRICPDGKKGQNPCPTDGSYFQFCGCDTSIYKFDSTNCTGNKTLGTNTCDGKSDSCSCDAKYQYTTANCTGGKALSGNSCDGKYETCGCPAEYSKTCSSPMIGGETACDGKYKTCKCPTSFATCNYGEDAGATKCTEENGTVKWSSCKSATCESGGYVSSVPVNQICTQITYNSLTCYKDCGEVCSGYTKGTACPNKYYTLEKCPQNSEYIKCTGNCGAYIVDKNPTYTINEINYNGTIVVTKDLTYLPSGITILSNVNFPEIAECKALPKPTVTQDATIYGESYATIEWSADRIENIDFVANIKPYQAPTYCSDLANLGYSYNFHTSTFCKPKCTSYNSYDCCGDPYSNYGECRDDCNYSGSNYGQCSSYISFVDKHYSDPCDESTNTACNTYFTKTMGIKFKGRSIVANPYGVSSSQTNFYIIRLKNVDVTVNGSGGHPKIGMMIGGGAHWNQAVHFEGTNSLSTPASTTSIWARGHNTGSYGYVWGILQVESGAKLTINKPACIYNQWNGKVNNYGTISGTVNQNCTSYPLSW